MEKNSERLGLISDDINRKANEIFGKLIFFGLLISSVAYVIIRAIAGGYPLEDDVLFAVTITSIGVLPLFLVRMSLRTGTVMRIQPVIVLTAYAVALFSGFNNVGLTSWGIIFMYMAVAAMYTDRIVLLLLTLVPILYEVVLMIKTPQMIVTVDASDYLGRMMIIFFTGIYALQANRAFRKYLVESEERRQIIVQKDLDLSALHAQLDAERILHHETDEILQESREANSQLRHIDLLTGLPLRTVLQGELEDVLHVVAQGTSESPKTAVLYVGCDDARAAGNLYGHTVGDELVRISAQRIKGFAERKGLSVAFAGGDEFVLLACDVFCSRYVEDLCLDFLEVFRKPIRVGGRLHPAHMFIGVAMSPEHGTSAETLLRRADVAMSSLLLQGKTGWAFYGEELEMWLQQHLREREMQLGIIHREDWNNSVRSFNSEMNHPGLPDLEQVSAVFRDLAREASDAILRHYHEPSAFRLKSDDSPVTDADEEANRIIVSGLNNAFPWIPVLAEESADDLSRMDSRLLFVVDPLDGTKEYLKRNGEFSVNIALLVDNQPTVGHIRMPVTGQTFHAIRGKGAWMTEVDGGLPVNIRVSDKTENLCIAISRSHPSPMLEELMRHNRVSKTIVSGSSMKGCLIARGEADVYYRYGRTMEWDTAAMQCIVEEAGGVMRQMDGSPMVYNKSVPENADGFFIVNRLENRLDLLN